jgi:polyisoprenoid-binding protein YceI
VTGYYGFAFPFTEKKKMMRTFLATSVALIGLALNTQAAEKQVTLSGDNTEIKFVGTKKDGKHEGGFKKLNGQFTVDDADLTKCKIEVTIDMNSTWSDDEKLTAHLKNADFFGVNTHPTAKFVSSKMEKTDKGYTVHGDLTLCGKTKHIHFPATVTAGQTVELTSKFTINRGDFGMTYGAGKIDDQVQLTLKVTAK